MANRKPSRVWTFGLPIAMLPVLAIGIVMGGAGHGDFTLLMCATFPAGLLYAFVLDLLGPGDELFALPILLLCIAQWAFFGYLIDSVIGTFSHAADPSVCVRCGYQLRALTEPRCPECGTPFDAASLKSQQPDASARPPDREP